MVQSTPENRDGCINFDQAGRLSGNWYHESLSVTESASPAGWSRHLAFVRDSVDPSRILISVGGVIANPGTYSIGADDPDPASVTTASGPVTYHATSTSFAGQAGPFVVTMLSDTRIRVEFKGVQMEYVR